MKNERNISKSVGEKTQSFDKDIGMKIFLEYTLFANGRYNYEFI